ncbi:hypothetical protein GUJ93_ZPchr0004g39800 [Zizania palustris]|uniref:SPT2 chromatin protein n=1 Tax=Zizania palustris TaxID=103762 RepID=A0A8J5VZ64_ZIZPA|nr:hypothetical protein GUJ93_ZPchr0004g39800 [Zizania palustris]
MLKRLKDWGNCVVAASRRTIPRPCPCSPTSRPCALRDCGTDTARILLEMGGYEYATNGYHQAIEDGYEDEYYSQDDYEEEGSGAGEEYAEEDEPPEGQQEFLEIRERLKEQIRRKAQAVSTAGRSSSSHDRKPPPSFGSFFGPSKPVISQRVIEERKSMKELQNTMPMSRDRKPSGKEIPSSSSSKVQPKTNGLHQKQKIVNEVKRKAEALKDNRDYSFLLSDDVDIPSSQVEKHVARSSLTQKSNRELTHSAVKSRALTSTTARVPNGYGLKNTSSTQKHAEIKDAGGNREKTISLDNGRMHSVGRNGSSQATTSKAASQKFPSKHPIAIKPPIKSANDQSLRTNRPASKQSLSQNGRPQSSQNQRIQSTSHGQRPHQPMQSQRPHQSSQSQRPQQSQQNPRPQLMSQSQRPQQSLQRQRPQPSSQIDRLQSSDRQRPQSSQGQRPLSSPGHYSEQRRVQSNDRGKLVERQIRPLSKPMPSRPISSNGMRDAHAKKKQLPKRRFNDGSDDEEDPLAMIRSMFRYDPSKYAGRDEDDSDMEADFATIEREEKRSARIARQEDEEQLRLIEEEERREQDRKRRKMAHGR